MNRDTRKALVLLVTGCMSGSILLAQDEKAPDKTKPSAKKNEPADTGKGEAKGGEKPEAKGEKHSTGDMDAWMKMAAAGEHHKKLDVLAGAWNLSIKYADDRGGESKGTAEFKWVMDGRFLVETTQSDMGGMTFEWMAWHGYDNQKKQYVSAWVDNFGTGIDTMSGQFDDAKKMLTYTGQVDDHTGGKQTVKWIMTLESKNKFTTRMIEGVGNGKERVAMEITATRG